MPSATRDERVPLRKWQRPGKTQVDLPWADIQLIDITNFDAPGEKQRLAEQLRKAVSVMSVGRDHDLTRNRCTKLDFSVL